MASGAFLAAGSGFPERPPPCTAFLRGRKRGCIGVTASPESAAFRRLAPLNAAWLRGRGRIGEGYAAAWHLPNGDWKVPTTRRQECRRYGNPRKTA